ncbi:hypothetical protein BGW80DRAFT_528950 [Lactifluus volemus]|nr:hypothetical protein BGW80DRAFT_528950 [Lactifluus volemus]
MVSKFDIQNTLPGLRHDFCALWNEITREAHDDQSSILSCRILWPIRHVYISLHQGIDSALTAFDADTVHRRIFSEPPSYPLCKIPDHHPTITSPSSHNLEAILNCNTPTAPDITPDYSRIHLKEHTSRHDNHSLPVSERHDDAIATPDLATAETHADTPIISPVANSESHSRPATAASTTLSPSSPTLPSNSTVAPQYNTLEDFDLVPDSIVPEIPPSSSSPSVPSDTLPVDPLTFPISQIDQIISRPGSLRQSSLSEIPSMTAPRQETFVSQPELAPIDARFNADDNSRTRELSRIVDSEALQQPDEQALPVRDMAFDPV